jgi:hypothetical protein
LVESLSRRATLRFTKEVVLLALLCRLLRDSSKGEVYPLLVVEVVFFSLEVSFERES